MYDSVYDPVYTTHASLNRSRGKPLYRATPGAVSGKERANFFRRPIVPFLHVRSSVFLFLYLFYIFIRFLQLFLVAHAPRPPAA